ncbi:MAG TPA: ABC transporter permease [Lachnospiraceae bacterium]|nr:ABC transporter permease [Lachnospiraceae bacterium]
MIVKIELRKLKRTGYVPVFLVGTAAASAFPVIDMAARNEAYISQSGNPFVILLNADWQMMAMINILLAVCGACIMYHTEYAQNGAQKMALLPIRPEKPFWGKAFIAAAISALMLPVELLTVAGCASFWFSDYKPEPLELLENWGFSFLMLLPTIMLMLAISSMCRNMWISLGIGVILVFTLSIFPQDILFFRLCPFSAPYQILETVRTEGYPTLFSGVCIAEAACFGASEHIYLKIACK